MVEKKIIGKIPATKRIVKQLGTVRPDGSVFLTKAELTKLLKADSIGIGSYGIFINY